MAMLLNFYEKLVMRWPFWVGIISIGVLLSLQWNLNTIERHAFTLAQERGRYTFKIIESTRLWVAKHGVAYVEVSDTSPSTTPRRTLPSGCRREPRIE